jgi:hypothetical protein
MNDDGKANLGASLRGCARGGAGAWTRKLKSTGSHEKTPLLLYYVFPWSLGSEDTFSFTFICIRGAILLLDSLLKA